MNKIHMAISTISGNHDIKSEIKVLSIHQTPYLDVFIMGAERQVI
jgi:hypothetical protein